jgi:glycosyltransferase involved in cell wall biosynthesis
MRFHVISLPHTEPNASFGACAFTNKVRGFCKMMYERGHEVVLYAAEGVPDCPYTELVPCLNADARRQMVGELHYTEVPWDPASPAWSTYLHNVIVGLYAKLAPTDFICLIGGRAMQSIVDEFPNHIKVEFGVGYGGFCPTGTFRVFESYAWMHLCYGSRSRNPNDNDGVFYDAVIPGYLNIAEFPLGKTQLSYPYFMYLGRLIDRKGFQIAIDAADVLKVPLWTAGPGTGPRPNTHLGVLSREAVSKWVGMATALFVPTQYIEPFGNVAIEAMACGTPAITTDWGAFTETVIPDVTGYRCRTLGEFVEAGKRCLAGKIDPQTCRDHVEAHYTHEIIGNKYEDYFTRLNTLWGKGWYDLSPGAI